MLKNFNFHCPTKDEAVTLTVNYIRSQCLEDVNGTPYTKGIIKSCTGLNNNCCSRKCYSNIPTTIYM